MVGINSLMKTSSNVVLWEPGPRPAGAAAGAPGCAGGAGGLGPGGASPGFDAYPRSMTTIIGLLFFSAIRLSKMKFTRPPARQPQPPPGFGSFPPIHDDDHRLALLLCNQVVKNEVDPPLRRPTGLVLTGSVLQVQHRVAPARAGVVLGRRVHQ